MIGQRREFTGRSMPELPEVERFRELLLPLISEEKCLEISLTSSRPSSQKFPRYAIEFPFHDENQVGSQLSSKKCPLHVDIIERKGKLLCMHIVHGRCDQGNDVCSGCGKPLSTLKGSKRYIFIHFMMTGRISTKESFVKLESSSKDMSGGFPPPHTHIVFKVGEYSASLSDPRKFGYLKVCQSQSDYQLLAPDALCNNEEALLSFAKLTGQPKGIKSLLLDQKYAVSGIGNWIADEVLFQTKLHPNQIYLDKFEVDSIRKKLQYILETAIGCLSHERSFPEEWLFHRRWSKKSGKTVDQSFGKVTFISSGGRTSAIVQSKQKERKRKPIENKSINENETRVQRNKLT